MIGNTIQIFPKIFGRNDCLKPLDAIQIEMKNKRSGCIMFYILVVAQRVEQLLQVKSHSKTPK